MLWRVRGEIASMPHRARAVKDLSEEASPYRVQVGVPVLPAPDNGTRAVAAVEPDNVLSLSRKSAGAYYTPDAVAVSLSRWAVRSEHDCMLDPACGDGRFIARHPNSVGVDQDLNAAREAAQRAPAARVHHADFFEWAGETADRFECVVGNPPFIRYQRFKGVSRQRALTLCAQNGAIF
jgi:hypothetical protein